MKLIKLPKTHYIITDDVEIKEGDWVAYTNLKKFVPVQYLGGDLTGYEKKITHSTQLELLGTGWMQSVLPLSLSEVEELVYGYSVEKMAEDYLTKVYNDEKKAKEYLKFNDAFTSKMYISYIEGFRTHKELVKDKFFTVEDMERAYEEGFGYRTEMEWDAKHGYGDGATIRGLKKDEFIKSILMPNEWDVEFDEHGKLKLV